ncbi:MAG TPA: M14 family metallocarboxypeptidase [Verrucomicrobiae bacterium]|nr:M14 family metallocarboxypeptidase [Verrucomicrobiae bacterium]
MGGPGGKSAISWVEPVSSVDADGAVAVARVMSQRWGGGFVREIIGWQRGQPILCFRRAAVSDGARRLYISAGIHGDEPAGPIALAALLEEGFDFCGLDAVLFPALAPDALVAGSRTNIVGIDLNRDYRDPQTDEARAHLVALSGQGDFDLAICLHEDWEAEGSYIYEVVRAGRIGMAKALLGAMASHIGPDGRDEIDGHRAEGGIIRPGMRAAERPDWPEAIFLFENHCPIVYTLETPSGFVLDRRVAAHRAAVLRACEILAGCAR